MSATEACVAAAHEGDAAVCSVLPPGHARIAVACVASTVDGTVDTSYFAGMHPESRLRRAWVARIGGAHPLPLATTSEYTTAQVDGVGLAECSASAVAPRRLRWDALQV